LIRQTASTTTTSRITIYSSATTSTTTCNHKEVSSSSRSILKRNRITATSCRDGVDVKAGRGGCVYRGCYAAGELSAEGVWNLDDDNAGAAGAAVPRKKTATAATTA
jgi:hypothetical protein